MNKIDLANNIKNNPLVTALVSETRSSIEITSYKKEILYIVLDKTPGSFKRHAGIDYFENSKLIESMIKNLKEKYKYSIIDELIERNSEETTSALDTLANELIGNIIISMKEALRKVKESETNTFNEVIKKYEESVDYFLKEKDPGFEIVKTNSTLFKSGIDGNIKYDIDILYDEEDEIVVEDASKKAREENTHTLKQR